MSRYLDDECEIEDKRSKQRRRRVVLEDDSDSVSGADGEQDAADDGRDDDDGASDMAPDTHSVGGEEDDGSDDECSEHQSDLDFIDDDDVYDHCSQHEDDLDTLESKCEELRHKDSVKKRNRLRMSNVERQLQDLEDQEMPSDDEHDTMKALKMLRKMTEMGSKKHEDLKQRVKENKKVKLSFEFLTSLEGSSKQTSIKDILKQKTEAASKPKQQAAAPVTQVKVSEVMEIKDPVWCKFWDSLGPAKDIKKDIKRDEAKKEAKEEDTVFMFVEKAAESQKKKSIAQNTEKLKPLLDKERMRVNKNLSKPMIRKPSEKKKDIVIQQQKQGPMLKFIQTMK